MLFIWLVSFGFCWWWRKEWKELIRWCRIQVCQVHLMKMEIVQKNMQPAYQHNTYSIELYFQFWTLFHFYLHLMKMKVVQKNMQPLPINMRIFLFNWIRLLILNTFTFSPFLSLYDDENCTENMQPAYQHVNISITLN